MHFNKSKLIFLGFIKGGVPMIMDMVSESMDIHDFIILKNVDQPEIDFSEQYNAKYYKADDYQFNKKIGHPVQFGVHHGHIKPVLFNYFLKSHKIDRENYIDIIHSSCYVAPSASHESGVFMEPLSIVSSMSRLGFGVSLKLRSTVSHHVILGDFVTLNPGALLSGCVTVGEGTEIGSGAIVSNNIKIGKHCLIGAGSVVTRDIPDGVIAYGNPCKVIRDNERWSKIIE